MILQNIKGMAAWHTGKYWIGKAVAPSTERASVGRQYESLSKAVYRFLGLKIIIQNKRFKHREIDLLAFDRRDERLVVVEVRGRQKSGRPALHWMSYEKWKHLQACANQIAARSRMPVRIELIEWVGIPPRNVFAHGLLWWRLRLTGTAGHLRYRVHRLR